MYDLTLVYSPELVEDLLATCRIAIAIASNTLIDVVVIDASIQHGFDSSFETELWVVNQVTRLYELGQSNPHHVYIGLLHVRDKRFLRIVFLVKMVQD